MSKFEITESTILDFLNKMGWKYVQGGKEIKMPCPNCGKKDGGFSINVETSAFKCHRENNCGYSGNLVTLMRDNDYDPYKKKLYLKPSNLLISSLRPKDTLDRFLDFYGKREQLETDILKRYEVGFLKKGENTYVTFPYISEDGELLDVKYRNIYDKKDMRHEKDAKKIFFGQHQVDPSLGILNITEGEKDAMALAQYGCDNCVSVPNGCKNVSQFMVEYIQKHKFKRINLFFDMDSGGREGAKRFAEKVGTRRCYNVTLPHKDVQDCLKAGVSWDVFEERIEVAERFKIDEKIENATFLDADEQLELWEEEVKNYEKPISTGYDFLDTMLGGGLYPKQVVGIMAEPGCYKTASLQQMLLSVSKTFDNEFNAFCSMEMTIERETQRRLQLERGWSRDWLRTQASNNSDAYKFLKMDFLKSNRNYMASDKTHLTISQIKQMVLNTEEQTGRKCRVLGVDFLGQINPDNPKAFDPIGDIMDGLVNEIAKPLNVTVILLIHSNRKKVNEEFGLSMGDGKGGRSIEQLLDTYVGLFKDHANDRVLGRILKHRDYEGTPYPQNPYFELVVEKFKITDMKYISMEEIDDLQDAKKKGKRSMTIAAGDLL